MAGERIRKNAIAEIGIIKMTKEELEKENEELKKLIEDLKKENRYLELKYNSIKIELELRYRDLSQITQLPFGLSQITEQSFGLSQITEQ